MQICPKSKAVKRCCFKAKGIAFGVGIVHGQLLALGVRESLTTQICKELKSLGREVKEVKALWETSSDAALLSWPSEYVGKWGLATELGSKSAACLLTMSRQNAQE